MRNLYIVIFILLSLVAFSQEGNITDGKGKQGEADQKFFQREI